MFIFRRISSDDSNLNFITENKAFNDLAPDKTLKTYVEQDIIEGGNFYTYILLKESEDKKSELLGLLRYKLVNIYDFRQELNNFEIIEKKQVEFLKWFSGRTFSIIYLSRIGVSKEYQEKNISQIIYNFFEFIIKDRFENVLIYVKILKNLIKIIGPSYIVIAESYDEKWGNFYLAMKIIKSEK